MSRALGAALVCAVLVLVLVPVASAQSADTTPPTSTLTTIGNGPNADGWSMGNRQFTIDATDDQGAGNVERIVYEVIATGANSLPPTTHLGFRANFQVRFEGLYTVRWYAVDRAGNAETPQERSYKHDNSSPQISDERLSGDAFAGWFRDSVTITATATDPQLQDGNAGSGVKTVSWPVTRSTTGAHTVLLVAEDRAGQQGFLNVEARVDADAPQVSIDGCPTAPVPAGTQVPVTVSASDVGAGLASDPSGTYQLATNTAGSHERTFTATDVVQHSTSATCAYTVVAPDPEPEPGYDFRGFFWPVQMDEVNVVDAGDPVFIRFSLGGYEGRNPIADGWPKSERVSCSNVPEVDGTSSTKALLPLAYIGLIDQYLYVWRTESSWAGTCRQFVLKLDDGSTHRATFRFVRHWGH